MKKLLVPLLILLITSSCATTERGARSYYLGNKDKLAKLCLDCFDTGLKPVYIKGDVVIDTLTRIDSVKVPVYVDCPDGTKVKADCPPNETKYITKRSVDTIRQDTWQTKAKLTMIQGDLLDRDITIGIVKDKLSTAEISVKRWRNFGLIGWLIIGVGIFLKVKRVF